MRQGSIPTNTLIFQEAQRRGGNGNVEKREMAIDIITYLQVFDSIALDVVFGGDVSRLGDRFNANDVYNNALGQSMMQFCSVHWQSIDEVKTQIITDMIPNAPFSFLANSRPTGTPSISAAVPAAIPSTSDSSADTCTAFTQEVQEVLAEGYSLTSYLRPVVFKAFRGKIDAAITAIDRALNVKQAITLLPQYPMHQQRVVLFAESAQKSLDKLPEQFRDPSGPSLGRILVNGQTIMNFCTSKMSVIATLMNKTLQDIDQFSMNLNQVCS